MRLDKHSEKQFDEQLFCDFFGMGFRIFVLDGQNEAFVWDATSKYLAKVPKHILKKVVENNAKHLTSLEEKIKEIS